MLEHSLTYSSQNITLKQFLQWCVDNKYRKIRNLLKQISYFEASCLIHAKDDEAFRQGAANGHLNVLELLLEYTPDSMLRSKMLHAQDNAAFKAVIGSIAKPISPSLLSCYIIYCMQYTGFSAIQISHAVPTTYSKEKHGKQDLIYVFLNNEPTSFAKLALSLEMTHITSSYIAKTALSCSSSIATSNKHIITTIVQYINFSKSTRSFLPNDLCGLIAEYAVGCDNKRIIYYTDTNKYHTQLSTKEYPQEGCCIC